MAAIPARPTPRRLRTRRNPANLPLRLEPKLMIISIGKSLKEQYTKSRAVPIYRNYSFWIDEFPGLICPSSHRLTIVIKAEMDMQERNQRILWGGCWEVTDMSQAAYSCNRCKLPNGDWLIICNSCNFDNAPST